MNARRRCTARWALSGGLLAALVVQPAGAQAPFPYRLKPALELGLGAAGAAMVAGGFVIQSNLDTLTTAEVADLDPLDVNAFDRGATRQWDPTSSTISDALVLGVLAAPAALLVTAPGSREPLTVGVMYAEVLLLGNGVTGLIKGAAKRPRPYVYNDDPDITLERKQSQAARTSFPSGHTTNAFAAAVFLSTVYGRLHPDSRARPWIWAGSLTAATAVGVLRYEAGKHFPTDVLAGAAIGVAIGWLVPRLHETDGLRVAVLPAPGGAMISGAIRY